MLDLFWNSVKSLATYKYRPFVFDLPLSIAEFMGIYYTFRPLLHLDVSYPVRFLIFALVIGLAYLIASLIRKLILKVFRHSILRNNPLAFLILVQEAFGKN